MLCKKRECIQGERIREVSEERDLYSARRDRIRESVAETRARESAAEGHVKVSRERCILGEESAGRGSHRGREETEDAERELEGKGRERGMLSGIRDRVQRQSEGKGKRETCSGMKYQYVSIFVCMAIRRHLFLGAHCGLYTCKRAYNEVQCTDAERSA